MKDQSKYILVTGGAGYIGSHMVRLLLEKGYKPVVFDNLRTGYKAFVPRHVPFVKGDLRNKKDVYQVFRRYRFDAVIHFAASTILPESIQKPLQYYENNVLGSLNLLSVMLGYGVKKLIFSSTAAVYGEPKKNPVKETYPVRPTNPYGISKLLVEDFLQEMSRHSDLSFIALRYFNVAGAHPKGDIGPTLASQQSLIPVVMRALRSQRRAMTVFGDDYDTPDGTCIRDYVYVMDLCRAHFLAFRALSKGIKNTIFNLGSGSGFSVQEVIAAAENVSGRKLKVKIDKRRPGDMPEVIADTLKAEKWLKWRHQTSLKAILRTSWEWEQRRNIFV